MLINRGMSGGALLILAAVGFLSLPTGAARAADPFVDTRVLQRHGGQVLPDMIPYDSALGGKTSFLYRHEALSPYEPGWDTVADAPKPVAVMAGVSEASTSTLATRLRAAGDGWAAGAAARSEQAHSYKDGAGSRVDFGYERESEWLGARVGHAEDTLLSFGMSRDVFDDARLLNYGLDVDSLDQGGARATLDSVKLPGWFNQAGVLTAWGYAHIDVDNFSLRAPSSSGARINGVGDHQSLRMGGWAAHDAGDSRTVFGTEAIRQEHSAKRYGREYGTDAITAIWVPDVEVLRASAWAEQAVTWNQTKVEAGLRYDLVGMSAEGVHQQPRTPVSLYNYSPQQLYDRYYGPGRDNDSLDHNISGRLRAEQSVAAGILAFADVSRLVRSPDYGERYLGNTGPTALLEVGNPELRPEQHHRLTLGGNAVGGGFRKYGQGSAAGAWRVEASGWHDRIDDFVTIDTARLQPGVLRNDRALIYRNVDASISGVSADVQSVVADHFAVRLNLTGQRGRNRTDGRPLHQVAPFEANLFLDTFGGDADLGWNAGTRLRAVASRRSVDGDLNTGNGQDTAGPAGGFATLDVYGGLRFGDDVAVTAGIDNVFDKLYREHIKATPQTSQGIMPNAPGRTLILRALVSF